MEIKIDGLLSRGDRVAVALSGGKDSVALFHALCALEDQLGIEVLAVNVEHGIRGEASVADSLFVKELCDNARKRLLFYEVDAPAYARERKIGLEAAARELRYKCFFTALEQGLCDKIATAHHASDNAESILLNILRGSGIGGASGMSESAYGGRVVRPLLGVEKEQIDAYITQNQLKYVTDSSNFENEYSRNFIRNEALPLIKTRFPEAESALVRFASLASVDNAYLNSLAEGLVSTSAGEARVRLDDDFAQHLPVVSRAIIMAARAVGLEKDYEQTHVASALALMHSGAGSRINLPHGFVAECGYGELILYKDYSVEPFELQFCVGEFDLPCGKLTVEEVALPKMENNVKVAYFAQNQQKGVLFVDKNAIPQSSIIRNRRDGDRIRKFGGGSKTLKEFLIDKKIERRLRAELPVCADGERVLFVGGVEISADVAVKSHEAYKITYERKTEENRNV